MDRRTTALWCLWCAMSVWGADALQEAAALKTEALSILQQASASSTDPKAYGAAMVKLEQAQKLLEQAKAEDSPLGQEIVAALFWARKFSNVQSAGEADRLRGSGGSVPPPPAPPKTAAPTDATEEDPALAAQLALARKRFEEGERFAREQAANDFVVALKWFQVADETSGTDYGVKALSLARAAQERYAAKAALEKAAAEGKSAPAGPEYDLVLEGDRYLSEGKTDLAMGKYEESWKLKDNAVAHRKLGHVLFDQAQAMKDKLMPLYEAHQREYREALKAATRTVTLRRGGSYKEIDWNNPRLVAAKKEAAELTAKGREAIGYYDRAALEFSKVLNLLKTDLDAAAHQALCYSVRGDANSRAKARLLISALLKDYQPANDVERTLYEFCRTELKRITPR